MKALAIVTISLISLLATSTMVFAGNTGDPGVNARQDIQKNRIKDGVRSGELTARETRRLRKQQQGISRLEKAYKADGHLSRSERRHLHRAQNKASKRIYQQKHDGQTR